LSAFSTAGHQSGHLAHELDIGRCMHAACSWRPKASVPIRRRAVVNGRLQKLTMPCWRISAITPGQRVSAAVWRRSAVAFVTRSPNRRGVSSIGFSWWREHHAGGLEDAGPRDSALRLVDHEAEKVEADDAL
jgi:hypothetical protein